MHVHIYIYIHIYIIHGHARIYERCSATNMTMVSYGQCALLLSFVQLLRCTRCDYGARAY